MKSNPLTQTEKILLILVIFIVFGVSILPILYVVRSAGPAWRGIFPEYATDAIFYFSRMIKGTSVFPFGNNPFFIEHVKDLNLTPSAADYIASIPLKFGFSLTATLILNSIFWNIILILMLWLLFKELGIKTKISIFLPLIVYAVIYGFASRPVIMQITLPFFMAFLILWINWHKDNSPSRRKNIFLAAALSLQLYIYSYNIMIAGTIMGLTVIWLAATKHWLKFKSGLFVVFCSLLFSLPALVYVYKEISNPLFAQVLPRLGAVNTRIPSLESFYAARWIVLMLAIWYIAGKIFENLKSDTRWKNAFLFVYIFGLSILAVLMNPIVTGRDTVLGPHVSRDMYLWLVISLILFIYFTYKSLLKTSLKNLSILVLTLILVIPVASQVERGFKSVFRTNAKYISSIQRYADPVSWLDNYDPNPGVVLANTDDLSDYTITNSRHFVLFPGHENSFQQYLLDISEIEERYLVSKSLTNVTAETLDQDFDTIEGTSEVPSKNNELKLHLCKIIRIYCFDNKTITLQKKNAKIQELLYKYQNQIKPNLQTHLEKYHVKYLMIDLFDNKTTILPKIKSMQGIYNDGRFIIYEI